MNDLAKIIVEDSKKITDKVSFSEIVDKDILITGASGLVGHYIIASFLNAIKMGHKPKCVHLAIRSDLPDYFSDILQNLPHKIYKGDITDYEYLSKLPRADFVIHAAGYGQPGKFSIDPEKTISLNTLSTNITLGKTNPKGKYVFLSSSEVYSGLTNPPYKESQIGNTNTDHPRSCYIEGKRCGEAIVNAHRTKGVDAKSARLSLAYGPGTKTDDTRAINNFIKKALVDKKIVMLDKGEAMRTYIYITDAVEIIFNILFSGKDPIYNVGGKSRTSIADLAKKISDITNSEIILPENDDSSIQGAPSDVYLDMTKIEKEFNKNSYIELEEGLNVTIKWQDILYNTK